MTACSPGLFLLSILSTAFEKVCDENIWLKFSTYFMFSQKLTYQIWDFDFNEKNGFENLLSICGYDHTFFTHKTEAPGLIHFLILIDRFLNLFLKIFSKTNISPWDCGFSGDNGWWALAGHSQFFFTWKVFVLGRVNFLSFWAFFVNFINLT